VFEMLLKELSVSVLCAAFPQSATDQVKVAKWPTGQSGRSRVIPPLSH